MKRIKKYLIILILVISLGFILSISFTFAKYVGNTIWDYFLSTKGFYLSSDNLNNNYQENINDYWDKERVYFNIKNNQNELLITEYDIEYEVTCEVTGAASLSTECLLDGTDSNITSGVLSSSKACINHTNDEVDVKNLTKSECENGGYSWENQITNRDLYFDIIFNDEEFSDIEVEITLKSTIPYKKTLTGKFILKNNLLDVDYINLKYYNYENTGNLVVSNSGLKSKIIELNWNANELLIDKDSPNIDSYSDINNYINKIYTIIKPKSSINFTFYKINPETIINENNFNYVIINDNNYHPEKLLRNVIIKQNGGVAAINEKSGPNFEIISSDLDSGLYKISDNYGDSYYFRGNKELLNNNLIFAEQQWKIVRINGDGSLRLIYNGACPNNICTINSTGSSTSIITTYWNEFINDNKYIGYMYGGIKGEVSLNKLNATKNDTSSNVKTVLEEWYKTNLVNKDISITSLIEDKIFCNDRYINDENKGYSLINTVYEPSLRILESKAPSLTCNNKNDCFTQLEAKIGNGALNYPVGLLTVDEVNIAGIISGIQNTNNYLYTGQTYWLLSPSHYDSSAYNFVLNYLGYINSSKLNSSFGLRPVININSAVRAEGNGSITNPYILK